MNTFWLKVAAVAVVVLGLIILVNVFFSKPEPKPKQKTVYDVWERDEERLRAEPRAQAVETAPAKKRLEPEPPRAVKQVEGEPKPQFKELSLEEKVEAEKLFEMALFHRKSGRLPVLGYKKMVDYCREIIERWPDSEYAFKAKRMLRDIPEQYRKTYGITEEEIDLGNLK
jgi:hypothetical protein